jgi:hypothetical protein
MMSLSSLLAKKLAIIAEQLLFGPKEFTEEQVVTAPI